MYDIIKVKKGDNLFSEIIFSDVETVLSQRTASKRVVVITDSNVFDRYKSIIEKYEYIVIGLGEKIKKLETVESIYEKLISIAADRNTYIIGFGGGIVTDIAGFVASTYMRGVRFGFVATTLLSQVDASVGGKNGVNVGGYKNMAGVFNQPDFVICDVSLLDTLSDREFRAGLSEIIKAGLICNSKLFSVFEKYTFSDLRGDKTLLKAIIKESVQIKADIVERDERETSERKKLNLGHTFAHAIEKCSDKYLHGEAVAIGVCIAAEISYKMRLISSDDVKRIYEAIAFVELPVECDVPMKNLIEALKADKKRDSESISFILITSLGSCEIRKMTFKQLESFFI